MDSCIQKVQTGAKLGAMVGSCFGLMYGTYEASQFRGIPMAQRAGLALRAGAGGAVAFSFFLAVGTAIRGCGR